MIELGDDYQQDSNISQKFQSLNIQSDNDDSFFNSSDNDSQSDDEATNNVHDTTKVITFPKFSKSINKRSQDVYVQLPVPLLMHEGIELMSECFVYMWSKLSHKGMSYSYQ